MNQLIIEYTLFGHPKVHYINVNKFDLCGNASILEIIAAWNNYPASSTSEIRIVDLIPS